MKRYLLAVAVFSSVMFAPMSARADDDVRPDAEIVATPFSGQQSLTIAIPEGQTPSRLRGTLNFDQSEHGAVEVSSGGRVVAKVPEGEGRTTKIDAPLTATDLEKSGLVLGLRIEPVASGTFCAVDDQASVKLTDVAVDLAGTRVPPATISEFFQSPVEEVVVTIAPNASDAVIDAGLAAVGAISHRYGPGTVVRLDTTAPARPTPSTRVVALKAIAGDVRGVLTRPEGLSTLSLSGAPEKLHSAAAALGSEQLALATSGSVVGLAHKLRASDISLTQSLAELGSGTVVLKGYGISESYTGVSQSSFGGPVSGFKVHLAGFSAAVVDEDVARLGVYWNDSLLTSILLKDARKIGVTLDVPRSMVKSSNGLVVRLQAQPRGDFCRASSTLLSPEVNFDTSASTVTATRGRGLVRGFAQFPQVLGPALPVALGGTKDSRVASAMNAATVIAALQQVASHQLEVSLVSVGDLLGNSNSGLLIGATAKQAAQAHAPLRLGGFRFVDYAEETFGVGVNQPFGALEMAADGGRRLVVLGGWDPAGGTSARLQAKVVKMVADIGWTALADDLALAVPGSEPFTVNSNAVVPQDERTDEYRSYAKYGIAFLLLLAVILAARGLLGRRRRHRITAYVDAQEKADDDGHRPSI